MSEKQNRVEPLNRKPPPPPSPTTTTTTTNPDKFSTANTVPAWRRGRVSPLEFLFFRFPAMKNTNEKKIQSLKKWLRSRGREFVGGKLQRIPRPRADRGSAPTLDFAEALTLGGIRDACAANGSEVVAHDDAFNLVRVGLSAHYRGPALEFDRSTFDDAVRAMSNPRRWWVVTRWPNRRRRMATAKLTRLGKLIADSLPAATGTPLEPADFQRALAVVIADRRRIAAKVVREQPQDDPERRLNQLILTEVRKVFANFNAKQATNEGTTTTTTTFTTEGSSKPCAHQ